MTGRVLSVAAIGVLEGALLVRLVASLLAARPDNRAIELVLALTTPLIGPFRALDQITGQPQFGARLELSSISAMLLLSAIAVVIWTSGHASRYREEDLCEKPKS